MSKNHESKITPLDRINLRLSGEMFDAIDLARAARAGRISRNTWIAEAIEEKLDREAKQLDASLGKASNA